VKIGANISISLLATPPLFPPFLTLLPQTPAVALIAKEQASRLHFQRKKAMEGLAI
jgi:hypothetical protein